MHANAHQKQMYNNAQAWKKDAEDPGYAKMGCGNPICAVLDRKPMR